MDLKDLYQEIILDHGKNPRNLGKFENFLIVRVASVVAGRLGAIILKPSRVELPAGGIFCGRVEF